MLAFVPTVSIPELMFLALIPGAVGVIGFDAVISGAVDLGAVIWILFALNIIYVPVRGVQTPLIHNNRENPIRGDPDINTLKNIRLYAMFKPWNNIPGFFYFLIPYILLV
jgi:hypothetical protein